MAAFGNPTMAMRLRYVADNLSRVYAPEPMVEGDDLRALINQLRAGDRHSTGEHAPKLVIRPS